MDAGAVGAHLGARLIDRESADGATVALHRFAAEVPGYPGWEWQAVVACAAGSTEVTVNEVCLMPGEDAEALRAPQWVPFSQRIRPGDLQPGMTLPPDPGDPRLTRAADESATAATDGARGGRARRRQFFLSSAGRDEAAARWRAQFGPDSESARAAARHCESCAFFIPLGEQMQSFGVCANEFAADGRSVHAGFGCGAHSETARQPPREASARVRVYDDEQPVF